MTKKLLAFLIFIGVLICLFFICAYLFSSKTPPYRAWGNVDTRTVALSFQIPGRIQTLNVDEGTMVKKGEILGVLDPRPLILERNTAQELVKQAQANYDLAKEGFRKEDIEKGKAAVTALESKVALAKLTLKRMTDLYKRQSASEQNYDTAKYTYDGLVAELASAKAQYAILQGGLRPDQVKAAKAELAQAQSRLALANYNLNVGAKLIAPVDGLIRGRLAENGDMAAPNRIIYDISLITPKRLRVYVSEPQLRYVHPGDKATVLTDTTSPMTATVASVSDKAEFTPKTVQTQDLRTLLVYEVRLTLPDPDNLLKLGQPITVDFDDGE
ncbi:hypothetical protein A6A19_02075 [Actinobacillus delphinicola]|uniref:HlyD family efflux transporter periplasmic adaptor subunit n=1 Tax=Actinobacillus delphinicola TaxID=51161 RepID=UPI00244305E5|nr:HlyD family efflux transporter periplasmic adaptor subunit [Actinobacillus delphinicola]MDG6896815.1 hypothetical protein [Actinobacillus delphinicola]